VVPSCSFSYQASLFGFRGPPFPSFFPRAGNRPRLRTQGFRHFQAFSFSSFRSALLWGHRIRCALSFFSHSSSFFFLCRVRSAIPAYGFPFRRPFPPRFLDKASDFRVMFRKALASPFSEASRLLGLIISPVPPALSFPPLLEELVGDRPAHSAFFFLPLSYCRTLTFFLDRSFSFVSFIETAFGAHKEAREGKFPFFPVELRKLCDFFIGRACGQAFIQNPLFSP